MIKKIRVILLASLLLNLNAHVNCKTIDNQEVDCCIDEQENDLKDVEVISEQLHDNLKKAIAEIDNEKEQRVVVKLIKAIGKTKHTKTDNTDDLTYEEECLAETEHKTLKDAIYRLCANLTSPSSVIAIAIAVTIYFISGVFTSEIALEIIHELHLICSQLNMTVAQLCSCYKWGLVKDVFSQLISIAGSYYTKGYLLGMFTSV